MIEILRASLALDLGLEGKFGTGPELVRKLQRSCAKCEWRYQPLKSVTNALQTTIRALKLYLNHQLMNPQLHLRTVEKITWNPTISLCVKPQRVLTTESTVDRQLSCPSQSVSSKIEEGYFESHMNENTIMLTIIIQVHGNHLSRHTIMTDYYIRLPWKYTLKQLKQNASKLQYTSSWFISTQNTSLNWYHHWEVGYLHGRVIEVSYSLFQGFYFSGKK